MDRQIVYIGQIPQDTDQLQQNKNAMIGLGYALQAVLGTSTVVDGLACTPTIPAGLTVNVTPGSIYSLQNVDGTAYGSLPADTTDQIVKQGIVMTTTNLSCPAPATTGQSINYLVQVAYQDQDGGSTVLPYYNASNPSVAWSGPNNTGVSQNTVRKGVCVVQVKAGIAATTGSQTTPSPDAGFTGLYSVTVANGQSTITSGNISQLSTAPFISPKLPNIIPTMQAGAFAYATDTSLNANTISIALSPVVTSLTAGLTVRVKVANTNTGPVVINTNGLGNVSAKQQDGSAIPEATVQANGVYDFTHDGTGWQFKGRSVRQLLTANKTWYVNSTSGSDSNNGLTPLTAWATIQHAWNVISATVDLGGCNATIQLADGTYSAGLQASGLLVGQASSGGFIINGNPTTPSNVVVNNSGGIGFQVTGASLTIQNLKISGAGTCTDCISASNNAQVAFSNLVFGASTVAHIVSTNGAQVYQNGNYSIVGGSGSHLLAQQNGFISASNGTVTLTGAPAFSSAYAIASQLGNILATATTFSGTATGTRYSVNLNGIIQTNGAGTGYFPGSIAGSTATGGQYA